MGRDQPQNVLLKADGLRFEVRPMGYVLCSVILPFHDRIPTCLVSFHVVLGLSAPTALHLQDLLAVLSSHSL